MQAGRVGRPHGLDGSFYVTKPLADALIDTLVVRGQPTRVTRRAGTDAKPILRLEGAETREAAEELRGEPLLAPASTVPLQADEYWEKDLVGCEVVGLGVVRGLAVLPSCEALEVQGAEGIVLVPLVRDAIVAVDLDARRIEVDLEFLG